MLLFGILGVLLIGHTGQHDTHLRRILYQQYSIILAAMCLLLFSVTFSRSYCGSRAEILILENLKWMYFGPPAPLVSLLLAGGLVHLIRKVASIPLNKSSNNSQILIPLAILLLLIVQVRIGCPNTIRALDTRSHSPAAVYSLSLLNSLPFNAKVLVSGEVQSTNLFHYQHYNRSDLSLKYTPAVMLLMIMRKTHRRQVSDSMLSDDDFVCGGAAIKNLTHSAKWEHLEPHGFCMHLTSR